MHSNLPPTPLFYGISNGAINTRVNFIHSTINSSVNFILAIINLKVNNITFNINKEVNLCCAIINVWFLSNWK